MNKMMMEPNVSQEVFFSLTAIGGSEKIGSAKIDSNGTAYTLTSKGWRLFPGGRMGLEDSFNLHEIPTDPSPDMTASNLPKRD